MMNLKDKINKLPFELRRVISVVSKIAQEENVGVYLAGGFVRDLLLNRGNLDLDFVVEKEGIDFAYKLAQVLGGRIVKHKAFGTATITITQGLKVDIATCRQESYPAPAALPVVSKGDIKQDLFRRDFTINAMACHIDPRNFGKFVDIFGGLTDLKRKRIVFLHENSFCDDPTRIIRAVRFKERFRFVIEADTLRFIKEAKGLMMLEKVQPHRLRDEFILICKEPYPSRVLDNLDKIYNLTFIDKELKFRNKINNEFKLILKTCGWFQKNFPNHRGLDAWLMYLIAFLSQLSMARLKKLIKDYAFCRGDALRMVSFKDNFLKLDKVLSGLEVSFLVCHRLLDPLSYEVILLVYALSKRKKTRERIKRFLAEQQNKKLSITGKHLLSLGLEPGPHFRKVLNIVHEAKIKGKIKSFDEELSFAKKIIKKSRY